MDSTKHRVSVVIPAYNSENTLAACIESALGQTLRPYEILVINDGSSDKTAEVARIYGSKIIYREQENQGQGAARNTGLEIASGDFVAFLDADDYWLDGFLEKCVTFLEKYKDTVAVSTGFIVKRPNRKEQILPPCLHGSDRIEEPIVLENFFSFWAEQDHVRTGSNVIRRAIIEEAGYQRADLRISQDLEYWGYIATFGKWGFIPEPWWVGNSQAGAVATGWLERYRQRRRLCPTVEAWEKRIVARISSGDAPGFGVVRGRVAAGFAHNKILAGNFNGAFDIVRKYGSTMPHNRLTSLMKIGAGLGRFGWSFVCTIIRMKEFAKASRLHMLTRVTTI